MDLLLDLEKDSASSKYTLPSSMTPPKEEVPCGCTDHPDKKEWEAVYNLPAKQVFEMLFSEEMALWKAYHESRKDKRKIFFFGRLNGSLEL